MLTGYKEHGFHICAEVFPEACTACPFWWYAVSDNTGMCAVTGKTIQANGSQDKQRMATCPIERWRGNK